ncbi:hypothetical protein LINPERHAP2_LOCUS7356 [Linum perenne]
MIVWIKLSRVPSHCITTRFEWEFLPFLERYSISLFLAQEGETLSSSKGWSGLICWPPSWGEGERAAQIIFPFGSGFTMRTFHLFAIGAAIWDIRRLDAPTPIFSWTMKQGDHG